MCIVRRITGMWKDKPGGHVLQIALGKGLQKAWVERPHILVFEQMKSKEWYKAPVNLMLGNRL
jgi:hypothetical protein